MARSRNFSTVLGGIGLVGLTATAIWIYKNIGKFTKQVKANDIPDRELTTVVAEAPPENLGTIVQIESNGDRD